MQDDRSYRESGRVPLEGVVALLAVILAGGGAAGAAVGALDHMLRVAYVNGVLGLLVASFLGAVVGEAAYRGRVRNTGLTMAAGAAAGLVAWGVAWVVFMSLGLEHVVENTGEARAFLEKLTAAEGHGLGSPLPWWVAQALAMGGLPARVSQRRARGVPFCELCGVWIEGYHPITFPSVPDLGVLRGHLIAGELDDLVDHSSEEVDPGNYLRAEVHRCEECRETCFVTLVRVSRDGLGPDDDDEEEQVTHLLELRPAQGALLLGDPMR